VSGHDLNILVKRVTLGVFRAFQNAIFPSQCLVCGVYFNPPQTDDLHPETVDRRHIEDDPPGNGATSDPARSVLGNGSLKAHFEVLLAPYVCRGCLAGFRPVRYPYCSMCGVVFKSREDTAHLCGDCIRRPKPYCRARAAGLYTPGFMELLHQFKYRGKIQLAGPLGMLLLAAFQQHWNADDFDMIVPVPLHKKKMRKRGFNQTLLLVDGWGRSTGAPHGYRVNIPVEKKALARIRQTAPQTGLGRAARQRNIKRAFQVPAPEQIKAKRILLVDDVFTTGATAGECARVLLKEGAERVDVLTLARAL